MSILSLPDFPIPTDGVVYIVMIEKKGKAKASCAFRDKKHAMQYAQNVDTKYGSDIDGCWVTKLSLRLGL